MLGRIIFGFVWAICVGASAASSQTVSIAPGMPEVAATVNGIEVLITRQATGQGACPDACIQPLVAAPGVATYGELEVMQFLTDVASAGQGLLIDTRLPEGYQTGSIPGSVNLPAPTLDAANPFRNDILKALGAQQTGSSGQWSYSGAQRLVLFCAGPTCDSAANALRSLVGAGYPPERLGYYRGGVAAWQALGLNLK